MSHLMVPVELDVVFSLGPVRPEVQFFHHKLGQLRLRERQEVDDLIDSAQKLVSSELVLEDRTDDLVLELAGYCHILSFSQILLKKEKILLSESFTIYDAVMKMGIDQKGVKSTRPK